jgi:hypothetical protein
MEVLRGYRRYLTYRRTLEQTAGSNSSNAELAVQAANALRDEASFPVPRKRLVGINALPK